MSCYCNVVCKRALYKTIAVKFARFKGASGILDSAVGCALLMAVLLKVNVKINVNINVDCKS